MPWTHVEEDAKSSTKNNLTSHFHSRIEFKVLHDLKSFTYIEQGQ